MASQYPDVLDTTTSLPNRSSGDLIPSSDNNDKNAALIALEKKVGIGVSDAASATTGQVPKKQANGTTAWSSLSKADVGLSNVPNTDATNRANHTGSQTSSTISDFQEAVQDAVAALLAAGTSISLAYDDAANTLTITGTGGGGLDAEAVRDAIGIALIGSGLISVTVNDAADTITISTTATQNDTDANLKNRANHTGTQAIDTVSGLQSALDDKSAVGHTHNASDINAGTLPVARGGTGKSTLTSGRILTGNGTLGVLDTLSVNTDPTLASNSDSDISTTKASKAYIDSIASGLDLKASVRVATTTAGTLSSSFANGQTIDGVTLVTGDRILIKNQSTGSENGIYVVNASGAPTRASDANSSAKVTAGMFTYVEEGTANADKGFALTTNNPITLGTTVLVFSPFNNGTGTPGGSDKQIQINDDGAFAGSANLTLDESGVVPILAAKARVELGDVIIGANEYTPTVVYVGDSLTYGVEQVGVDYPYNHYIDLPTWNGMIFEETNIGVGGLTLYKMKERMAKYQNVLYHQKSPLNIMVVWGGINDLAIANGAHSPQETYSVMAEFCRHARQLGWRVAVLTMISGDNGSENFDTSKNTYNGLLRTTWQDFADVLIDVAANPYLGADGAHSNGTYFLDGVHLTNTGYALVGSIVEEYLTAYIDQATTIKTHAVGFVRHGSNADYPRPLGYAMVIWDGSVQPNNMATYDQWVQPTS